jgi:hypothetical protein
MLVPIGVGALAHDLVLYLWYVLVGASSAKWRRPLRSSLFPAALT